MSASDHTPGPWQLHKSDDTLVIGTDGREVAEACGDYTEEAEWPRMEANARLIAAAPELLAALKRAESHFGMLPSGMDEPGSVMAEIRAAIAKAEGRS